jgi:hypothetical protein
MLFIGPSICPSQINIIRRYIYTLSKKKRKVVGLRLVFYADNIAC